MGRLPQYAGRKVQPRKVSRAASNCALTVDGTSTVDHLALVIYQQAHMDYISRMRVLRRSHHLGVA